MKIEVTANDILRGRRMECDSSVCYPIALTLKRQYPLLASVTSEDVCIHLGRTKRTQVLTRHDLPANARQFVNDYDLYGRSAVKPFVFELVLDDSPPITGPEVTPTTTPVSSDAGNRKESQS